YNAMIQTKCVQSATFLASGRTRSQAVNSTDSLRSPTPVSRQSALTKILTPIKLLSSCVASISASPADELRRIAHPSNTQQCRQLLRSPRLSKSVLPQNGPRLPITARERAQRQRR